MQNINVIQELNNRNVDGYKLSHLLIKHGAIITGDILLEIYIGEIWSCDVIDIFIKGDLSFTEMIIDCIKIFNMNIYNYLTKYVSNENHNEYCNVYNKFNKWCKKCKYLVTNDHIKYAKRILYLGNNKFILKITQINDEFIDTRSYVSKIFDFDFEKIIYDGWNLHILNINSIISKSCFCLKITNVFQFKYRVKFYNSKGFKIKNYQIYFNLPNFDSILNSTVYRSFKFNDLENLLPFELLHKINDLDHNKKRMKKRYNQQNKISFHIFQKIMIITKTLKYKNILNLIGFYSIKK